MPTSRCFAILAPPALALALLAASVGPALAAWPNQPTVNLPVCTAAGDQTVPMIVGDGAGGAIVTWQDQRSLNHIYAQHVLPSGAVDPAWPPDGRALCLAANGQYIPVIASDGAGGAIVAWQDYRSGAFNDIYAQHVLASGAVDPAWPLDGRALCTAASHQIVPTIVSDGAGGAIVAWQDLRGGLTYDVYAQHVLASGAVDPAWPLDGRALCIAAANQVSPMIVSDGAGGAIVTWQDYRSGTQNDIYAQHVLASGAADPAWPLDGRALCTAAGDQLYPMIVSDGTGGAIVTWQDGRSGTWNDIYAQHVLASGAVDPAWPLDGRAVCLATNEQSFPVIVTDSAGGAIVAWQDARSGTSYDIYAQHVLPSGTVDPAWPLDGHALCAAAGNQTVPSIVADGAGGAIATWQDYRGGANADIYAQHVLSSGAVDPEWPLDGRTLCTAAGRQLVPTIAGDGAGGAIVTWQDYRGGTSCDLYAQRVEAFGRLGNPEPQIASVKDVPLDNGGHVKASWYASYLDAAPYNEIASYEIWRSVPSAVAQAALRAGARLVRPGELAALAPRSTYMSTPGATPAATPIFWEYVANQPARRFAGYSYELATTGDSIGAGIPKIQVMILARDNDPTAMWSSAPASGYSVDNLPPFTPAPFAANYAAGVTHLHWNPNTDADLAGYRLYRDASPSFTPSPAALIASPPDTGYADAASATYTYKLTAVDVHGNESPAATISPAAITGVDGGVLPRELALAPASPNPASRGTTLRFALPAGANVSLGVYDAAGRLVRSLASGALPPGEHAVAWDLRDAGGRIVGAGLYFARLEAGGRTLTRRIVLTP